MWMGALVGRACNCVFWGRVGFLGFCGVVVEVRGGHDDIRCDTYDGEVIGNDFTRYLIFRGSGRAGRKGW